MSRDLGDFQTPPALVAAVLDELGPIGRRWPRVLEPTCGRGHFLAGLLGRDEPPREIIGIEIQDDHAAAARAIAQARPRGRRRSPSRSSARASSTSTSAATWPGARAGRSWSSAIPPGSPTPSSGCSPAGTCRRKWNVKGARGLDARTGASNFDIAEAIWLKLIDELAGERRRGDDRAALQDVGGPQRPRARRAAGVADRAGVARHGSTPRRWFGAEVEACLFRLTLGAGPGARGRPRAGLRRAGRDGACLRDRLRAGPAGRRSRRLPALGRSPTAPARSPGGKG